MHQGRVWKSTGSWYRVELDTGPVWDCRLKGKFKLSRTGVTNPIAVGDRVEVEAEPGQPGKGLILNILPRENYLIRKSVHKSAQAHILASNLSQVIVLATLSFPRTSTGFIDRILVSAESFGIPACVFFNKSDLLGPEEREDALTLAEIYSGLGYPSRVTSVVSGENLEWVREILSGKTSLLAGHSGVGKSSLINALFPHLRLATGRVSTFANKGTHTTTYAEMHRLDPQTRIIDSPGIKELGLMDMEDENLSQWFPEMRTLSPECRFYNCTHIHEPGCAVIQALEEGYLQPFRYHSYLSMVAGEDNRR